MAIDVVFEMSLDKAISNLTWRKKSRTEQAFRWLCHMIGRLL